jgi:hypothetical protein
MYAEIGFKSTSVALKGQVSNVAMILSGFDQPAAPDRPSATQVPHTRPLKLTIKNASARNVDA